MKKAILLITILILVTSCSSLKEPKKGDDSTTLPEFHLPAMLEGNASITTRLPGFNQTFNVKYHLAGRDSMSMTAFGPFNIVAAKLYSDKDEFIFLNMLEQKAYRGTPSADNIRRVSGLNLSFEDLISMVQGVPPLPAENYELKEIISDKGLKIFVNKQAKEYGEFIVYNSSEKIISQFQRKDAEDNLILNVFLSNYKPVGNYKFPGQINIELSKMDGKIFIETKEYKLHEKPINLMLTVPSGINIKEIE